MSLLYIDNVSKKLGDLDLIEDMNLRLEPGKCIAIKCSEEISTILFRMIYGKVAPSKGSFKINGESTEKNKELICILMGKDAFYERLTVKEHLNFYKKIYNFQSPLDFVMEKMALYYIQNTKLKDLNYSQRKRLSFARALISGAKLLLLQEPTLSLDRESLSIIRELIPYLCSLGISIIATSVALEDAILLGGEVYTLDYSGFKKLETEENVDEFCSSEIDIKPSYNINKIPVKQEDKIILFNPNEISYIESIESVSYIIVKGEKFKSSLTLAELENRLKSFGFFRCHRSYLVNLQMIREIVSWSKNSFSIILEDKNKSSIPLSKGKIIELKEILRF